MKSLLLWAALAACLLHFLSRSILHRPVTRHESNGLCWLHDDAEDELLPCGSVR